MRRSGSHNMSWFEVVFGFREGSFHDTQSKFSVVDGGHTVVSSANGSRFYVGPFETPTVADLRMRLNSKGYSGDDLTEATKSHSPLACCLKSSPGSVDSESPRLVFENIRGDVQGLIRDPENAGSVFQVASQFNCLEMMNPNVKPESGITRYASDPTQGPKAAVVCPAATVYRNYFAPSSMGQAGGYMNQIDCLGDVGRVLGNDSDTAGVGRYWSMQNGYCLPSTATSIVELGQRLQADDELVGRLIESLRVGVHWDTEVRTNTPTPHRVCQVFCSAVPVSYSKNSAEAWEPFAAPILAATYEATLAAAALLARSRPPDAPRLKVYLTKVGGGVFGNEITWISAAIQRACQLHRSSPLDVKVVHYGVIEPGFDFSPF